ncbi:MULTISPECIES: hypothetical protein [Halomonadaceae]|uniref:hypothetical protein n=1 Tax=Halomonadaceae TaxID=28256 RepID=UPI00159878FA|nr:MULTISPECIES: hypothetical protein [Halomonas]QJQ94817.1 hypothetical protein HIO72_05645 [Halomonas sp. PA5]
MMSIRTHGLAIVGLTLVFLSGQATWAEQEMLETNETEAQSAEVQETESTEPEDEAGLPEQEEAGFGDGGEAMPGIENSPAEDDIEEPTTSEE